MDLARRIGTTLVLMGVLSGNLWGDPPPPLLVCGVALGFPPYQFSTPTGEPTGIDADVARLVFRELGQGFVFRQTAWDDLYLELAHQSKTVDVLCGAEVNPERQALFDFTIPYYQRAVAVFVKKDSPYRSAKDLTGKLVAGDRGGFIETLIAAQDLRLRSTASKEESFQMLQEGRVEAVMAPVGVGFWISRQRGLGVRTLPEQDPGSPVAFAVAKGNADLAARISAALAKLKARGQIEAVIRRYR
ncbi:MAG TPA: transporter substrate-binding domain-containing protein [Spirochaetia bacterium]|jgi:polar amino acid transport system substrate-binding protein|nr:transporter substrate-binding domain-containing protein [Spirochaetia bacterium]